MIQLGHYENKLRATRDAAIVTDDDDLKPYLNRPWFRAFLTQQLGAPLVDGGASLTGVARIPDPALAKHALMVGSTGSGKTRALIHLIAEQVAAGASAVILDPKGDLVDALAAKAIHAGIPPERVTVLDPRCEGGVPGWNPLNSEVPLPQAVGDLVALLEQSTSSWGPRMEDILTNSLLLVGAHGLSILELTRFLQREDYRRALVRLPLPARLRGADRVACEEALSYFHNEFGYWSRSEQVGAVAPVLNKVREIMRSGFLRSMLCARRNTIQLSRLWQEPHLLLVRLDQTALGEHGTRLAAGLLTHLLYRTALRTSGSVPVVLALDELPVLQRFMGRVLEEIVTVARSRGLRALLAAQHIDQLSESLRAALLANAAVQAFFRLGYDDAKLVAASLAAGAPSGLAHVAVRIDKRDRETRSPECAEWHHPVLDGLGKAVRIAEKEWLDPWMAVQMPRGCGFPFSCNPWRSKPGLERLYKTVARSAHENLYVRAADTGELVELRNYVKGLGNEYYFDGPTLRLSVEFPRPRFSRVTRSAEAEARQSWTRCLQDLPVRHAVLRVDGGSPGVVQVGDVELPRVSPRDLHSYFSASARRNGQSEDEVASVLRWRDRQVEQLAAGRPADQPRSNPKQSQQPRGGDLVEVNDGSLA